MRGLIDGRWVEEGAGVIPVTDRSFLYGDAVFETVRVVGGRLFVWSRHFARLAEGAAGVGIPLPWTEAVLERWGVTLARENGMTDGLLRVHLSRGDGPRGYSPRGCTQPRWVMTLHPLPTGEAAGLKQWDLKTSRYRLPAGRGVGQWKTANRLLNVLARGEAVEGGADEAVMLNDRDEVVEGSSANLFWVEGGVVWTPPLAAGGVAGVTRGLVLDMLSEWGIGVGERAGRLEDLRGAEGVFLTLTSWGVVEGGRLDGEVLRQSELTTRVWRGYRERLARR